MKTRIMLDIETLGLKPGSALLAVGAVRFSGGKILDEFYQRVDLQSCIDVGLSIDPSTVLWWFAQNEAARLEVTKPAPHLAAVMLDFKHWCHRVLDIKIPQDPEIEIWGNGASYDNVLLACASQAVGIETPWAHRQSMCYRTVKNLFPEVQMERAGTHHNALDDARSQALHLMKMLPNL